LSCRKYRLWVLFSPGTVENILVPLGSWSTWHLVTLAPFTALHEHSLLLMREVEVALRCVLWCARVVAAAVIASTGFRCGSGGDYRLRSSGSSSSRLGSSGSDYRLRSSGSSWLRSSGSDYRLRSSGGSCRFFSSGSCRFFSCGSSSR